MPALLLTNPRAGLGGPRLKFKGATLALGEQDLPDLAEYDLLIVEGGDGTLQRVMTELLARSPAAALPKVAVLPGGSTNMSAADINEHRGFRQCAARLSSILKGAPQPLAQRRPLVCVQPSAGDCDRRYGWFFGIGAVCSGIRRWSEKRPDNRLQASWSTAWALLREFQGPLRHQQVWTDGQQRPVFAMMATTLNRLLFGSRPYWQPSTPRQAANPHPARGSEQTADGKPASDKSTGGNSMHSTWVFAEAQGLLRRGFKLLRGDPALADLPGYQSGDTADLQMEFDGPYALDGELFENRGAMRLSLSDPIQWLPL